MTDITRRVLETLNLKDYAEIGERLFNSVTKEQYKVIRKDVKRTMGKHVMLPDYTDIQLCSIWMRIQEVHAEYMSYALEEVDTVRILQFEINQNMDMIVLNVNGRVYKITHGGQIFKVHHFKEAYYLCNVFHRADLANLQVIERHFGKDFLEIVENYKEFSKRISKELIYSLDIYKIPQLIRVLTEGELDILDFKSEELIQILLACLHKFIKDEIQMVNFSEKCIKIIDSKLKKYAVSYDNGNYNIIEFKLDKNDLNVFIGSSIYAYEYSEGADMFTLSFFHIKNELYKWDEDDLVYYNTDCDEDFFLEIPEKLRKTMNYAELSILELV